MAEADVAVGERVLILNVDNGERFLTYTIEGEPGQVELNGAAARLAEPGDVLIALAHGLYEEDEEADPTILVLDDDNDVVGRK